MPLGMQIWDASGNLIMDTDTLMGRVLGTVSTGLANGSVSNAGFSTGTPWWSITAITTDIFLSGWIPTVSVSGNTLSWNWGAITPTVPCLIVYGVY